jgi:hypothetical protein
MVIHLLLPLLRIWILLLLLSCQNQVNLDCDDQINQAEFLELKVNRLDQMTGLWHLKSFIACDQTGMTTENETRATDHTSFEMIFNLKQRRNELVVDLVDTPKNDEGLSEISSSDMGLIPEMTVAQKDTMKTYIVWSISSENISLDVDQILISQLKIPLDNHANENEAMILQDLKQKKIIDSPNRYGKVELITGIISSHLLKSNTHFSLQRIE